MSTFPPKDPLFDMWLQTFLAAACPNAEDRRILLAGIRKEIVKAREESVTADLKCDITRIHIDALYRAADALDHAYAWPDSAAKELVSDLAAMLDDIVPDA